MRYRLLVTKEDGTKEPREIEALNLTEAKDEIMGEPEVVDVQPIKPSSTRSISTPAMQSAIDQYVGTNDDITDVIGGVEE